MVLLVLLGARERRNHYVQFLAVWVIFVVILWAVQKGYLDSNARRVQKHFSENFL